MSHAARKLIKLFLMKQEIHKHLNAETPLAHGHHLLKATGPSSQYVGNAGESVISREPVNRGLARKALTTRTGEDTVPVEEEPTRQRRRSRQPHHLT
jgi:hypothetical protein